MLKDIQKIDYDRFITTIFIDKQYRGQVATLLRFNIELSRLKSKVSEPALGAIRLQWWKDYINALYNNPKKADNHDLKDDILFLIRDNKLINNNELDGLIDSRHQDFEQCPFNDIIDLENYLKNTAGLLNILVYKVISEKNTDVKLEEIINDISIAWGITAIIRSLNNNCSKGRWVLPLSLVNRHEIKLDNFGSFDFVKQAKAPITELLNIAEEKIKDSSVKLSEFKNCKTTKFLDVYIYLTKRHLKNIRDNDFDVFTKGYRQELGIFELLKLNFI